MNTAAAATTTAGTTHHATAASPTAVSPQLMHRTSQQHSETQQIDHSSSPTTGSATTEAVTNVSKNLIAGAAARSMAATLLYPLDVIKTRLQFQQNQSLLMRYQYINGLDAAKSILKNEGVAAFYRGLPIRLIYISPAAAVSFTIYENLKRSIMNEGKADIPPIYFVLFGAVARVFGTACKTPLDLLKQNLQVENAVRDDGMKRGFLPTIRQILQNSGLRGFWSGYGVTLLRDAPFASLYFASYELLKRNTRNLRDYMTEDQPESIIARDIRHLCCGSMSGLVATIFTIPVDVVKTRLQTQAKLGTKKYQGVFDAFSKIYREEGAVAFRKGLGPRLVSIMPSSALTFCLYEKLKTWEFFESFAAPDPTLEERDEAVGEV